MVSNHKIFQNSCEIARDFCKNEEYYPIRINDTRVGVWPQVHVKWKSMVRLTPISSIISKKDHKKSWFDVSRWN